MEAEGDTSVSRCRRRRWDLGNGHCMMIALYDTCTCSICCMLCFDQ